MSQKQHRITFQIFSCVNAGFLHNCRSQILDRRFENNTVSKMGWKNEK